MGQRPRGGAKPPFARHHQKHRLHGTRALTPCAPFDISASASGDVLQGAAADCNSAGETHAWFDSRVTHPVSWWRPTAKQSASGRLFFCLHDSTPRSSQPSSGRTTARWPGICNVTVKMKKGSLSCPFQTEMERARRFERPTLTLARLCSTPELRPHRFGKR